VIPSDKKTRVEDKKGKREMISPVMSLNYKTIQLIYNTYRISRNMYVKALYGEMLGSGMNPYRT